jgi:predicted dehydrogenase
MRNLRALGAGQLFCADQDPGRLADVQNELPVTGFTDYAVALAEAKPDAVLICTPPSVHAQQALAALGSGAHVFIEKPLSCSLDGVAELSRRARELDRVVQVGYNLRFHAGIVRIKRMLDGGVLGKVLWADIEFGQYLPDWRPWQDYRQSYTARRELGGGIVLDDTHEIDYPIWLFGRPEKLVCSAYRASALEMDVEDSADLLLRFENGMRATLRMDCVQRTYSRTCKIAGELGTISWDYQQNRVGLYLAERKEWQWDDYAYDPNDMYVAEITDFLERIENGRTATDSLDNAVVVLQTALAALRSSEQSRWVSLSESF